MDELDIIPVQTRQRTQRVAAQKTKEKLEYILDKCDDQDNHNDSTVTKSDAEQEDEEEEDTFDPNDSDDD